MIKIDVCDDMYKFQIHYHFFVPHNVHVPLVIGLGSQLSGSYGISDDDHKLKNSTQKMYRDWSKGVSKKPLKL